MSTRRRKEYKFKVALLGDQFVGKTSIFLRLKDKQFPTSRVISTGTDVFTKTYDINGHIVSLVIHDTAGVERFRSLTNSYYRDVAACLLVFSVDNLASFDSLVQWKEDADHFLDRPADKFVIGNKIDLENDRCVPDSRVQKFASEFNDLDDAVFYSSAKTGAGVEEVFESIAVQLLSHRERWLAADSRGGLVTLPAPDTGSDSVSSANTPTCGSRCIC